MIIKEKIKEIDEALDKMILSEDKGDSFKPLKKAVLEKMHEAEDAADVLMAHNKVDVSDNIRDKLLEAKAASEKLMAHEDEHQSKETGKKLRELLRDIKEATDAMVDDRMK